MRAANLGQLIVSGGRVLAKWSLLLRASLASGLGHTAAMVTMACLVAGGGKDDAGHLQPHLTVSTADEVAAPDFDRIVQTSSEELDRLGQPSPNQRRPSEGAPVETSVDDSTVVTQWLRQSMALPAVFSGSREGTSELASIFKAHAQLAQEFGEEKTEAGRNLGRSASFYGIEADGRSFVFVVDISGSMSGSRFRRARTELCQSVERLDASQSFFVVLFNDAPTLMPSLGPAAVDPVNRRMLETWLKKIECRGGTNPLPALFAALAMKPDAIFLLSDGKFDPTLAQSVSQLELFQRIPIHTIGFASRKGEPALRAISQVSGGTYRYVR